MPESKSDKTQKTELLALLAEKPRAAKDLPFHLRRFIRPLEVDGLIRFVPSKSVWVVTGR